MEKAPENFTATRPPTRVRKALKDWEDLLAKIVEDGQSAREVALTRELLPLVKKSEAGRIVNLVTGKADDKTGAGGRFSPYISAMIENCLTAERQP
jgi:hypothetical protein